MNSPAIHYNIGVAAYRSGDYQRAGVAFVEVAQTPAMAALAHYNLGLVALKRGDAQAARDFFERAARETTDERLAALAARGLAQLPPAPPKPDWSGYARAGAGYDDNVALRSDSIDTPGSGNEDAFADLLFAGSYSFLPSWRVDAAAGILQYESLDDFDQSAMSLGVARAIPSEAWYLEFGLYANRMTLGGEVYERSLAANARATRNYSGGRSLRAQLRATAVDGEDEFSGLSGSRAELGAEYLWSWQAWNFVALTRAELNDSEDDVFASRWVELGAEARWTPAPLWSFAAGTALRRTHHPANDTVEEAWDDDRTTIRLEAARILWQQARVFVRFQHERNDSPIEDYDYERNWISAAIEIWR
jgi:hypothetical protein